MHGTVGTKSNIEFVLFSKNSTCPMDLENDYLEASLLDKFLLSEVNIL